MMNDGGYCRWNSLADGHTLQRHHAGTDGRTTWSQHSSQAISFNTITVDIRPPAFTRPTTHLASPLFPGSATRTA